jgi:hypothetical protein
MRRHTTTARRTVSGRSASGTASRPPTHGTYSPQEIESHLLMKLLSCLAYWCPCILFGKTQDRNQGDPNSSGLGMMVSKCSILLVKVQSLTLPVLCLVLHCPLRRSSDPPSYPATQLSQTTRHRRFGPHGLPGSLVLPMLWSCPRRERVVAQVYWHRSSHQATIPSATRYDGMKKPLVCLEGMFVVFRATFFWAIELFR